MRRQDETLIVTDVPIGREFVTARQPFLAGGVKVRPLRQGEKPKQKPKALELSDKRRKQLIQFISGRKGLPDTARERILTALKRPRVPTRMVERIESRMKEMGISVEAAQ